MQSSICPEHAQGIKMREHSQASFLKPGIGKDCVDSDVRVVEEDLLLPLAVLVRLARALSKLARVAPSVACQVSKASPALSMALFSSAAVVAGSAAP